MDAPHLIDARRLIDAFADADAHLPPLVFALLGVYLEDGPFMFNASALAERLAALNPAQRVPAERLVALQPELERFFDPGDGRWRPRAGVLTYEQDGRGGARPGAGEAPLPS